MFLLCRQMYLLCGFFPLRYIVVISVAIGVTSTSNAVYPYRFFNQMRVFATFICMYVNFEAKETLIFAFLLIHIHTLSLFSHSMVSTPLFSFFFSFFEPEKSLCSIYYNSMLNFCSCSWVQVSVVYAKRMNKYHHHHHHRHPKIEGENREKSGCLATKDFTFLLKSQKNSTQTHIRIDLHILFHFIGTKSKRS